MYYIGLDRNKLQYRLKERLVDFNDIMFLVLKMTPVQLYEVDTTLLSAVSGYVVRGKR